MPDNLDKPGDTDPALQAISVDVLPDVAPALEVVEPEPEQEAAPASTNCTGELVLQPELGDTVYAYYECQTCHLIIPVAHEYLAEHGLPTEHSSVIV